MRERTGRGANVPPRVIQKRGGTGRAGRLLEAGLKSAGRLPMESRTSFPGSVSSRRETMTELGLILNTTRTSRGLSQGATWIGKGWGRVLVDIKLQRRDPSILGKLRGFWLIPPNRILAGGNQSDRITPKTRSEDEDFLLRYQG